MKKNHYLTFIIFVFLAVSLKGQSCASSFTFQYTSNQNMVWFKDLSSPNQANWQRDYTNWNFGDASPIDTNKITLHTYPAANIYTVTKTTQFSQVGNPSNTCTVINTATVDASMANMGCIPQTKLKVTWLTDSTYGIASYYSGCNYNLKEIAVDYGTSFSVGPGPIQGAAYSTNQSFFTYTLPTTDSVYSVLHHIILVPTPSSSSSILIGKQISNTPPTPTNCHASFFMVPSDPTLQSWTIQNFSSGAGPLTYFWNFGDATTSTLANPTHTYATLGTYTVCLTVTSGTCSDTFCSTALTDSTQIGFGMKKLNTTNMNVGLKKNSVQFYDIKLFPNPVSSELTISFEKNIPTEINIQVLDILGTEISSEKIYKNSNIHKLDLHNLSSGLYIIQLKNNNGEILNRNKIIKN